MYTDKYGIFTNKILIAATFLDVRTKLFGRFSDEIRKEFLKEAKNTIKTIISEFTTEQKQVLKIVNLSNIPDSLNTFEASQQKGSHSKRKSTLQLFDFNKDINNSKTAARLNIIDREIYKFNSESSKNIEPLSFWNMNQETYPILFNVVKSIFCIPATSVPSEQLFSATGYTVWERRNKLNPLKIHKMMVVSENL